MARKKTVIQRICRMTFPFILFKQKVYPYGIMIIDIKEAYGQEERAGVASLEVGWWEKTTS